MYSMGFNPYSLALMVEEYSWIVWQVEDRALGFYGSAQLAACWMPQSCLLLCSLKKSILSYALQTLLFNPRSRLALKMLQNTLALPMFLIISLSPFLNSNKSLQPKIPLTHLYSNIKSVFMLDFDSFFNKKKDPIDTPRTYRIRNREIREQKLLSQGAFGYIWKAIDVNTKEVFALKRVICSNKQRLDHAKAEMEVMGKLKQCGNVVKFYGGCVDKDNGNPVVITLMELCPNGNLFDQMATRQEKGFTEKELLKIVESIAVGIKSIHESGFAHRDIKIQNVLLATDNSFKLCDFGSCTSKEVDFSKIPTANYSDYEDEFQTNTTPMYRPPEIVDPFKKFKVSKQVDIWMLGCVLYTLVYFTHPFIDASKAGISDAAFRLNKEKCSEKINDLIRNMLTPNPENRVTVDQILLIISNWNTYTQIPLNKQAKKLKEQFIKKEQELSVYQKKTVGYDDDIPIEVLMKLQNELKQNVEKPLTTFKTTQQKVVQKPPTQTIVNKTSNQQPPPNNAFSGFQFDNIPKPTASSWSKNDDFFTQPIKKAPSLDFDFFANSSQSSSNSINRTQSLQSKDSNPIGSGKGGLTTQAQFYEFFSSDSGVKKQPIKTPAIAQTTPFDFL